MVSSGRAAVGMASRRSRARSTGSGIVSGKAVTPSGTPVAIARLVVRRSSSGGRSSGAISVGPGGGVARPVLALGARCGESIGGGSGGGVGKGSLSAAVQHERPEHVQHVGEEGERCRQQHGSA